MPLESEAKIFWCLSRQIRECLETGEVPIAEFLDEIDMTKTPLMGVA